MPIKVLVFESDNAFAGELRNELGKLGCAIRVVDDGNVGLQQAQAERPDLILLSIELPRMNGFSVCNKLKKDPDLKDVPLIIMSSESSDETFEQHKKLRTRAEAYVRKPIAFGDLRREIEPFVSLGGGGDLLASTGDRDEPSDIQIDEEEPALESTPEPIERAPDSGKTAMFQVPFMPHKRPIDPDVDAFADDAFGRLQGNEPEPRQPSRPPAPAVREPSVRPASAHPPSVSPPSVRARVSERPPADPGQTSTWSTDGEPSSNDFRAELEAAQARAVLLERRVAEMEGEVLRVRTEADSEAERLRHDLEELRTRPPPAVAPKGGSVPPKGMTGVSSREFLDLRETLSKKDKEILALKQQLTAKDKEIFEVRDRSLAYEGRASELDDKVLAKDRELAEASERIEDLSGQLETTSKGLADTQTTLERVERELEEVRAKREQENVTHEARAAAMKADRADAEAKLKADRAEAEARMAAERNEAESRLVADRAAAEAQAKAEREAAETELREEHATAMAEAQAAAKEQLEAAVAQHTAAQEEAARERAATLAASTAKLDELVKEHEATLASEATAAEERLAAAVASREAELKAETDTKLASLHRSQQDELQRLRSEAEARETALKEALEKANAQLETAGRDVTELTGTKTALETQLGAAASKAAALEEELEALRGELDETRKNLVRESSRATRALAKWDADKASLERAKDALAVALSQLDEAEARQISE